MGENHSFIPHALVTLRPAPWAHRGNDTVGRSESCNLAGRRARPCGAARAEGGMKSCPMTGPGNSDLRASSPIATPPPTQLIQHLSPCLFRYHVPPAPLQPPVAEQELPESGCCILGRPGRPRFAVLGIARAEKALSQRERGLHRGPGRTGGVRPVGAGDGLAVKSPRHAGFGDSLLQTAAHCSDRGPV